MEAWKEQCWEVREHLSIIVCDIFTVFMFVKHIQSRQSGDGDELDYSEESNTKSNIRHHQTSKASQIQILSTDAKINL